MKEVPICDENKPNSKWYQIGSIKKWKNTLTQLIKHFLICNGFTYILGKVHWITSPKSIHLSMPKFSSELDQTLQIEIKLLIFLLYLLGYLIHRGIV